MAYKLVKDIGEETWRKFVAYCKIKGVKVGSELEVLLKNHIKNNLNELFKNGKK